MNFKTRLLLPLLALAAVSLGSCNSSTDNSTVTTQTLGSCFAVVTDLADNSVTYTTDVSFGLNLNWTEMTADISVTGLKAGGTLPPLKLPTMTWGVNTETGWGYASSPLLHFTASYADYTISDFRINWMDRLSMGPALGLPYAYYPGVYYSFTLNDRYKICGSTRGYILFGTSASTAPDGTVYTTTKSYYQVQTDFTNMTAAIQINNAAFSADMPSQNMRFSAIPMTVSADGRIHLAITGELIPTLVGGDQAPQPEFPITNLVADITPGTGMTISFDCNVRKQALYTVTANTNYTDYTKLNESN